MKKKSILLGFNAKLALILVAFCGLFASCYEKENIDVPTPAAAKYTIYGNLFSASTGEAVNGTVTIGSTSVTTTNGYFTTTESAGGTYTVTVNLDGYLEATRTIFLPTVAAGEECVCYADIILFDATTQVVEPEANDPATSSDAGYTTFVGDQVLATDAFIKDLSLTGATVGNVTTIILSDGSIQKTLPVTYTSATTEEVSVPYFSITGFISNVIPSSASSTLVRSLSENDIWIASASKFLGRAYGFTYVSSTSTINPNGGTLTGYDIIYTYAVRSLTFSAKKGLVSYMSNVVISPRYDTTHDHSHSHGDDSNAGGGSGSSN